MSDEIVFEGDEFTRGNTVSGALKAVARSPVADFLVRRQIVRSERHARWLAVFIAVLAIGLTAGSAKWAIAAVNATPSTKSYAEMTASERLELPAKHRLYLERIEREREAARDARARDRFRNVTGETKTE